MGKLIVSDGDKFITDASLDKERLSIGRHPDNDIALDDRSVSGHHAVVVTILSDSFLEDLNSTNGTLVNGRQIAKHPLSNGDVITIGRHSLRYESDVEVDEDELEKTMILRPGQIAAAKKEESGGAAAPRAETLGSVSKKASSPGAKPVLGKLRLLSGANAGKELQLTKALTTIGKPGVQVAAVTRRPDGYYIVHVGAQNPDAKRPLVNGDSIGAHARQLASGDTIELAGAKMEFLVEG